MPPRAKTYRCYSPVPYSRAGWTRAGRSAQVALDSGCGQIVRVDRATGECTEIAFCPGLLRGLSIHRGHAIVTLSKPRDGSFKELALQGELEKRDAEVWCGVVIVNLASGDIVEWIALDGGIKEMFVLPLSTASAAR